MFEKNTAKVLSPMSLWSSSGVKRGKLPFLCAGAAPHPTGAILNVPPVTLKHPPPLIVTCQLNSNVKSFDKRNLHFDYLNVAKFSHA